MTDTRHLRNNYLADVTLYLRSTPSIFTISIIYKENISAIRNGANFPDSATLSTDLVMHDLNHVKFPRNHRRQIK